MSHTTDYRALQNSPLGKPMPQADSGISFMNQPITMKQTRQAAAYKIVLDTADAATYTNSANSDSWVFTLANFHSQVRGKIAIDRLQVSAGGTAGQSSMGRIRINGFGNHPLSFDSTTASATNVFTLMQVQAQTVNVLVPTDFTTQQAFPCPVCQINGQQIELIIDQSGYTGGAVSKIPIGKAQLIISIYDDGA